MGFCALLVLGRMSECLLLGRWCKGQIKSSALFHLCIEFQFQKTKQPGFGGLTGKTCILMKKYFLFFVMLLSACMNVSCTDDIEENEIVGTWHATVNGGKANISITFEPNNTGYLFYCWDNVNYHTIGYSFTYKISGKDIKTKGVFADSDPDEGEYEGSMTLTYSGGKLTGGRWATDNGYTKR